jgi:YbgC/YbaW family acyl-CoA thioester hydrolase
VRQGLSGPNFIWITGSRMLSHEEKIVIRFADADPAGVVFYPRLIERAHDAVENMIRHSALGHAAWFGSARIAVPLRHAEAGFFRPMRPGESFTARAAVEKIGETSVTFAVEFTGADGASAAQVRTVHVAVDKATGHPMALPEAWRRALGD